MPWQSCSGSAIKLHDVQALGSSWFPQMYVGKKHNFVVCAAAGTPNTSVLARSSSSVNGRVEVMMSHLPDGQGGGTPKPSFRVMSQKSTIHELTQVSTKPLLQHVGHLNTVS